ncbi:MAG: hypothetical protein M3O01_00240 [Pseudomonadota bacterium]|nr:hypothetical protein [Pseudomonadota bacterium]
MIDVRDDRKISDVIHGDGGLLQERSLRRYAVQANSRVGAWSHGDPGAKNAARSSSAYIKKRHVESMTRLPTKRLATACWDFIVVKRGRLQTAPVLDFLSLQGANSKNYQQVIHKSLWMSWG